MQGYGSSLSAWTALLTEATGDFAIPKHQLELSWKRRAVGTSFAIVGSSVVDGNDIVQANVGQVISRPDEFTYNNETDRALSIQVESIVKEPVGGVVYAMADVKLENTDLRFTPNSDSTIGTAIKPNRPVRINLGYHLTQKGFDKLVPTFKGLTQQPKESKAGRYVEIHALDYLSTIKDIRLDTAIYINKRTDEIIQDILLRLGFSTDQFVLDTGLNRPAYVWFQNTTTAGYRLEELVKAEEGHLYQDEFGIIRFENRRHYNQSPRQTVVHRIDAGDIIQWEELQPFAIINRAVVRGKPREVLAEQEVWRNSTVEQLDAGETIERWASLQNPITSFAGATAGVDYFANTLSDGTGTDVSSSVSIVATAFDDSIKYRITNNSGSPAYLTFLIARGTPAVVTNPIEKVYEDAASIDEFGMSEYTLESPFISTDGFAGYLAQALVTRYGQPARRLKLTIRAVPQLQLKDRIQVYDQDIEQYLTFRIMKIVSSMLPGEFTQTLEVRQITTDETDNWATVGLSTVAGTETVAPF